MTETPKINLLLLPGLLTDARLFQFQIEDLSDMAQSTVADLTVADTIGSKSGQRQLFFETITKANANDKLDNWRGFQH